MTNYQVGARLENLLRAQLKRAGYSVMRSAGSKGACDLIAWSDQEILFIQVKAYGANRPADLEKLKSIPCPPSGKRQLWERDGGKIDWKVVEV